MLFMETYLQYTHHAEWIAQSGMCFFFIFRSIRGHFRSFELVVLVDGQPLTSKKVQHEHFMSKILEFFRVPFQNQDIFTWRGF